MLPPDSTNQREFASQLGTMEQVCVLRSDQFLHSLKAIHFLQLTSEIIKMAFHLQLPETPRKQVACSV